MAETLETLSKKVELLIEKSDNLTDLITNVDKRVDIAHNKSDLISDFLVSFHGDFTKSVNDINENFETLNTKVDALSNDSKQGFNEVKVELKKIQATTNYEEQFANLKAVNN